MARLDGTAAEFLDQADIATLVAPRLGNHAWIECHAGQPGTVLAGLWITNVVRANKPLRDFPLLADIGELFIGRKIVQERAGRNSAKVAEIDLTERIAVLVLDVSRHIDPQEHGIAGVDRGNAVAGQEIPLAGGENDRLQPA